MKKQKTNAMALKETFVNNDSSKVKKQLFPNLCRVCMSYNKDMKCVFNAKTRTIEDLEFCTGILMNKEDGLPTKLCNCCLSNLVAAHKFKSLCLRSDNIFRKVMKKHNLPSTPQDTTSLKIATEVVVEVYDSDIECQELEPKREIDTDNNGKAYTGDIECQELVPKQEIDTVNNGKAYTGDIECRKLEPQQEIESDGIDDNDTEVICDIKLPSTTPVTRSRTKMKKKMETTTPTRTILKKQIAKGNSKGDKPKTIVRDTLKEAFLKNTTEIKKLRCSVCDMKFDSSKKILEHKIIHQPTDYICEICGKTFKHRSAHYAHIRSHLPPKYLCDQCDYKSWQKSDLNKHLQVHKGIKTFICEYCTKSFFNSSNLWGHIRRTHVIRKKNHVCPRCDRAFAEPDKLRRHLDTHDNIKRFECEVCHGTFSSRKHWKRHLGNIHKIIVPNLKTGRRKVNIVIGSTDG